MTDPTQAPTPAAAPAAPAAEAPAPSPAPAVLPDDGGFADAFAELQTKGEAGPTPTPAPTPAPAASPAPAAADVTGGASDASTGSEANPAAAPTGTPAPAPSPNPAAPEGFVSAADVERIVADRLAAYKPEPAPAPAPTPAPAPEAKPLYTAEEQATLTKYLTDWPDMATGEALQRRAEYGQLVQHIFQQLQPVFDAVNAVQERLPGLETTTQYRELVEAIPDYDSVRDPVIEWVGKQPGYLKTAYEKVTSEGTPDEIADLVTRFKKETGWVAPAATPAPAAAPTPTAAPAATPAAAAPTPAPTAALPAAAAAAAASLRPVKAGRSEPSSAQDPNDFDGAWQEFAKAS